jgi:hypothetical protein
MRLSGKTKSIVQGLSAFYSLFFVVSGYVSLVIAKYWMFPTTADGIKLAYLSAFPSRTKNLIDRYFLFYLNKLLSAPFHDLLIGYAVISLLYHVGIVIFVFLIARKLAGNLQALLASILTAFCPLFVVWATENFSDVPCLFFGLVAFYCSLFDDHSKKVNLRYFLCGFFLTASFNSKIYGIVFIAPILVNLWRSHSLKKYFYFLGGALGVLAFLVVCDSIWLRETLYHLNPQNYIDYKNYLGSLPAKPQNLKMLFFDFLVKKELIFYYLLLFAFGLQVFHFIKSSDSNGWRKRGTLSIAFSGMTLAVLFTFADFNNPIWNVQYNYNYCVFIPWIIAFCSGMGWKSIQYSDRGKKSQEPFIQGFLIAVFIFSIFTTGISLYQNLNRSSLGRFVYVNYFWLHILAIALVVFSNQYLPKPGHEKRGKVMFLIGCSVMIWHNAFWAHDLPAMKKNWTIETTNFLIKYRDLKKIWPVYPVACIIPRDAELKETLLLSRMASKDDIKYFYKTRFPQEILHSTSAPFFIFTKLKKEEIQADVIQEGQFVVPVLEGTYFGGAFYLIGNLSDVNNFLKKDIESVFVNDSYIKNGSFENWDSGASPKPIFFYDCENIFDGMLSKEEKNVKVGRFSTRIRGDNFNLSQKIEGSIISGKHLTCFVWLKTDVSNKYRIQIYDGVHSFFSDRHSGSGDWELLHVNFQANLESKNFSIRLVQAAKTGNHDDIVYADGALLVEGTYDTIYQYKLNKEHQK